MREYGEIIFNFGSQQLSLFIENGFTVLLQFILYFTYKMFNFFFVIFDFFFFLAVLQAEGESYLKKNNCKIQICMRNDIVR